MVRTLLRVLPLVLAHVDRDAMRRSPRLHNAVRLVQVALRQLKKIEQQQNTDNKTNTPK